MRSQVTVIVGVTLMLVACTKTSPPAIEAPVAALTASTATTASAPSSSMPVATSSMTMPGGASKHCMMVSVCQCNLGCAAIRVPSSDLRVGTRAKSESGALAGKELKIVELTDVTGAKVLALTDLDHDHVCSLSADRSLVGYGCAKSDSGPVPANACKNGCLE